MSIKIAERYRPFSHVQGTRVLIPGSMHTAQIFGSKLMIDSWEHTFSLTGPFKNFTITLDLEKGILSVFGTAKEGYFRYHILGEKPLLLRIEKMPGFSEKKEIELPFQREFTKSTERLSLGISKAQDIDLIRRRNDPREIFPLWHKMASFFSEKESFEETSLEALHNAFLTKFSGLFFPEKTDPFHQNLTPIFAGDSLKDAKSSIRSLFFRKEGENLFLLPALPKSFIFGKMTDISIPNVGILHLEWSKKILRRAQIVCKNDAKGKLILQPFIKSFRIKTAKGEKGKTLFPGALLVLQKGKTYYFDRFTR